MCLHFVIPSGARRSRGISQFMSDDRKTPEMRATMTDIERLRHSASHVLATAILKIWPEAQFAAGPPVENGFYYDVDLPHRISPDDFEKIEAEMKKEIKANHTFEKMEVSRDEALELGKKGRLAALSDRAQPSKFKIDIIEDLERLAKETEFDAGYVRVRTPHIARERLYKKSGHLPYYADSMFPPMQMKLEREEQLLVHQLERGLKKLTTEENEQLEEVT